MFISGKKNDGMPAMVNKTTIWIVESHKGFAVGISVKLPYVEGRRFLRHLISHVTPDVGEVKVYTFSSWAEIRLVDLDERMHISHSK